MAAIEVGKAAYLPAEALSVRPRFRDPLPEWLPVTVSGEGTIILTLFVSASGAVDKVDWQAPPQLERAAQQIAQLAQSTTIVPGEKDGMPANAIWRLEFTVTPSGPVFVPAR